MQYFQNLNKLNYLKIKRLHKKNLHSLDFAFFLSLLILDNTDNSDYFFYKFNISKKNQKRIKLIKEFYFNKNYLLNFNSQNLWKIFYFNGKEGLTDILNYKIFTSKKFDNSLVNQINYFKNKELPKLPITGSDLIKDFGIPEGEIVGEKLKEIENIWINNNFKISDKNLKKILKN